LQERLIVIVIETGIEQFQKFPQTSFWMNLRKQFLLLAGKSAAFIFIDKFVI
jgi:hypothetical protein